MVTIDAMGCQTKIAQTILDQGADYLLALKDNQRRLAKEVETFGQPWVKPGHGGKGQVWDARAMA